MAIDSVVAIPHKASIGCPTETRPQPLPKDFTTCRDYERLENGDFPRSEREFPRPLPDDFATKGLLGVDKYFPGEFFRNDKIDGDQKYFEVVSMTEEKIKRILWLACRMATPDKCRTYDSTAHKFGFVADVKSDLASTPLEPALFTDVNDKKVSSDVDLSEISPEGFESNDNEVGILNLSDAVRRNKSCESCVSDIPLDPSHTALKALYARSTMNLLTFILVAIVFLPVAAAAVTIPPVFRVLAGVSATGTAVAVIPLRTLPQVNNTAWIM